ncbi:MAG: lysophospholipid acyltransferase family protein [Planctomycetota bacterium]|nr:lysophospholipid acyltransferase family protein [Planctomycetota bacterium]
MSLRVPLRLGGLVAVTVPLFLGWLLTRPLAWLAPRLDPALQRLWIGSWSKASLWLMGVRARFEGEPPTGPFFMVANHLSYVDIPLLLSRLDVRFLAKSEIARWPVIGLLARSTGTLFIDRSRKRDLTRVLPLVRAVLDRGTGVIVFPEGTSTAGAEVERFKPSLFEVPVQTGAEVRSAALHYHAPDGPLPAWQAVCWWGDAPFGPHFLDFLKQPRTEATVTFAAETLVGGQGSALDRKALARAAQAAVEGVFTPSRPPESTPTEAQGSDGEPGVSSDAPTSTLR